MPILKSPAKATPAPAAAAKPLQSRVQPAATKVDPFAAKYNATDASTKGGYVPPLPGDYNTLLTAAQAEVDGEKRTAYFEFTIVDDGAMEGKTCRIYFNFVDENGNEGQGMPFFKQAMQMLGHDEEIESWDHMVEIITAIAEEVPWVIINVVKKGKWTNVFIDSVPENQDKKPVLP